MHVVVAVSALARARLERDVCRLRPWSTDRQARLVTYGYSLGAPCCSLKHIRVQAAERQARLGGGWLG